MILKTAPEIHGQHLTSEIGSAQDYNRNKERGEFPESYDLRIPKARNSNASSGNDNCNGLNDDDIAGALDDMNLGSSKNYEETKERVKSSMRRSYEVSNMLARASDIPSEAYMPIKALNQFSNDWKIKARVVKKGELRNWKNARGEGQLFNVDLIDREGTLIQATGFGE